MKAATALLLEFLVCASLAGGQTNGGWYVPTTLPRQKGTIAAFELT
jgi:hypothetical protein